MKSFHLIFGKRDRSHVFEKPKKTDNVVCKTVETVSYEDIINHRKNLGMSQAQFAKHLGISLRVLQSWEQNKRKPNAAGQSKLHDLILSEET